jgi:TPR repeat protein
LRRNLFESEQILTETNPGAAERPIIPASEVFENDGDPKLIQALVPYDLQDWDSAAILLEPIARSGNRLAIFKYANTLDKLGESESSEHFWRIAVAAGDANAANNLALFLTSQGRQGEVMDLYLTAAEGGSHEAMRNIGLLLVEQEPAEAEDWFIKSVAAGGKKACGNLAFKYFQEERLIEALEIAQLGILRGCMYSAGALAIHHRDLGEWEETLSAARDAVRLSVAYDKSEQLYPLELVALALIKLGRIEEAEEAIHICEDRHVENAEQLAEMLEIMKDDLEMSAVVRDQACTKCGESTEPAMVFCRACGSKLEVAEEPKTTFEAKCEILCDLWLDHRDDDRFGLFVTTYDIGLPLAYAVANAIVVSLPPAAAFIEEAFEALVTLCEKNPNRAYHSLYDVID